MHMSTTSGKGSLILLLFTLLSYLSIGLSVPTKSLASRFPFSDNVHGSITGSLVRRETNIEKYQQLFNEWMASPKVSQDTEQFVPFGTELTTLASSDFSTCFGVVVLAPGGVILGHYNADKDRIQRGLQNIPSLYEEHKDSLQGARAFLYASTDVNSEAYVDDTLAKRMEAMIRDELNLEPTIVKYTDKENVIKGPDGDFDIDDMDKWEEFLMYGTIVVRSEGDGQPVVEFVHLKMQKDPQGTYSGN